MKNDRLISRIEERLTELKISAREASIRAGGSPDLIRAIKRGITQSPRVSTIENLADVLETTPEWLTGRTETPPLTQTRGQGRMEKTDVPIYGSAAGTLLGGAEHTIGKIVDYASRPPGLKGVLDAYALYVTGDSMTPKFESGTLVFVHPHRPPRLKDTVIVQEQNGGNEAIKASIGLYCGVRDGFVVLEKLSPEHTEVSIPTNRVIAIHKVLSVNELFNR